MADLRADELLQPNGRGLCHVSGGLVRPRRLAHCDADERPHLLAHYHFSADGIAGHLRAVSRADGRAHTGSDGRAHTGSDRVADTGSDRLANRRADEGAHHRPPRRDAVKCT